MEDKKSTVRAVDRALDVLLCFTQKPSLSLTDITMLTSLHKSTVHRLLASLEEKGFVVRSAETDKYTLGFRIWELSTHLPQVDDPATILLPEMEKLGDLLGETISLYIRDGNERVRIQAVQSKQAIRRVAPIGARLPLYVGASSKILVAYADDEAQISLLSSINFPKSSDKEKYLIQLKQIRQDGYATSIEEREQGAAAVAVPIFDQSEKLAVVLSVSGPSNRLTLEKMQEHAPQMMEAAARMGKMLR
ncbi:IclR family transcriptional regulator [Longirhabdus pacifica]|uniref:IclR family transcriptional regulator n=1 Tax=Longirhabdus pacifica TaxID=2305227 RepID=UPI001008B808|nr:IclR family transcriptional regulator [Longirhabdus pacifica]